MNSKLSNAQNAKKAKNTAAAATTSKAQDTIISMTTTTTTTTNTTTATTKPTTNGVNTHKSASHAAGTCSSALSKTRKKIDKAAVGVDDDGGIDMASDASLYCNTQEAQLMPKPAPRYGGSKHQPPTPKPRSVLPPAITTSAPAPAMLTSTTSLTTASTSALPPANMSASAQTLHESLKLQQQLEMQTTPRSKQRLIKVDFSLLQDDELFFDEPTLPATSNKSMSSTAASAAIGHCSMPKMPPYPIGGYMVTEPPAQTTALTKPAAQTNIQQQQQLSQHSQQQQMPASTTTRVLRRTSI